MNIGVLHLNLIVILFCIGSFRGRSTVCSDVQGRPGTIFLCPISFHNPVYNFGSFPYIFVYKCIVRLLLQVYGIASEDMDSLTFATPKLIRNLMKPQTQNVPINEYDYDKVRIRHAFISLSSDWRLSEDLLAHREPSEMYDSILGLTLLIEQVLEGLSLTSDQFVDLCILCGCDYCGTIKGAPSCLCTNQCARTHHVCVLVVVKPCVPRHAQIFDMCLKLAMLRTISY